MRECACANLHVRAVHIFTLPPTVQPWGGIVFKWPDQIPRPVFMLVKYFRIEYTYKRIG